MLLVPGQILNNLPRQLGQRLTDRDRARRLNQPRPNGAAKTPQKLIDWESAHEPVLTCELSSGQVKAFIAAPMIMTTYPAHTQGVETVVKVTRALDSAE